MRCLSCRYDLRGLPQSQCPECGRAFDPADSSTFWTPDRPRFRGPSERAFYIALACLALSPAVLIHAAGVAATISLGHWPIPSVDDPGQVQGVGWLALAAQASILLLPMSLLIGLVVAPLTASSGDMRRAIRVPLVATTILATGYLLLVLDPFGALNWIMD